MSIKIQIASDLHLEQFDNAKALQCHPLDVVGDVLVLAGDVATIGPDAGRYDWFWDWCADNFGQTLLVPGNHEYYDSVDVATTLHDYCQQIRPNVAVVNNRSVVVGDVQLLLTTLWAQVPDEDAATVDADLSDCKHIVVDGHALRSADFNALHQECVKWLIGRLAEPRVAHNRVVVTHHCPIVAEDPQYAANGLSCTFVNAMEQFVTDSGTDCWVHGHTHYNAASGKRFGDTVVLSNQLGYGVGLQRDFCRAMLLPMQ